MDVDEVIAVAKKLAARPIVHPWHRTTNWQRVHHRIMRSAELGHPCKCPECETYMAGLDALRSKGEIQ